MPDVHNSATRSYNMSRVRSKDTKPELLVRRYLHSRGYRYKLHDKTLPGRPDVVLPRYRTVIFIHGCFWHGHEDCKYARLPATRTEWWQQKIEINICNDEKAVSSLRAAGWRTITVWGCRLKPATIEQTLQELLGIFA